MNTGTPLTGVEIRPFRTADAAALAPLYVRSVEVLGRRHYAPAQVAAWSALAPSPERLVGLMADGRTRLVAVDHRDSLLAFADLEVDGHIHFLYAAPEAAGTGIAAALHDRLEAIARAAAAERLYAEASEAACRFFRRQGYAVLGRRDFEVAGTPIHNYAVEKRLYYPGSHRHRG